MIHFTPLRTRRLSVRIKELSIGKSVALCAMAPDRHEATATEFLRFAIEEALAPSPKHVTDPRAWTVQERMWAIAFYLCGVNEGDFNFKVGDDARFSDYLVPETDFPANANVELGEIGGDEWFMKPLLGVEAEAIESLQYEAAGLGRFHWIRGAMAAQMRRKKDMPPVPNPLINYVEYVQWLRARIATINELPESHFTEMLRQFWIGQDKLTHFFRIGFDDTGVVALAAPSETKPGDEVRPARFRAAACVSDIARYLSGKANESGR